MLLSVLLLAYVDTVCLLRVARFVCSPPVSAVCIWLKGWILHSLLHLKSVLLVDRITTQSFEAAVECFFATRKNYSGASLIFWVTRVKELLNERLRWVKDASGADACPVVTKCPFERCHALVTFWIHCFWSLPHRRTQIRISCPLLMSFDLSFSNPSLMRPQLYGSAILNCCFTPLMYCSIVFLLVLSVKIQMVLEFFSPSGVLFPSSCGNFLLFIGLSSVFPFTKTFCMVLSNKSKRQKW